MERTNSSVKWGSVQLPLAPNPIQNAKKYHCVCVWKTPLHPVPLAPL